MNSGKSKRNEREKQFLKWETGIITDLSSELLSCALFQLKMALENRRQRGIRSPENHYTTHAIGSIVLLVTAFDAWLNEAIFMLAIKDQEVKKLATKPLRAKYYEIPKKIANVTIPVSSELDWVIDLRDEIVHYLPRVIRNEGNVPYWLVELHRRGLFITSPPDTEVDFVLSQKLCSYRLAYWAWETVAECVSQFLNALGDDAFMLPTTGNYERYREVCPPSQLNVYDVQYGLDPYVPLRWKP